jgi:hemoglobin/transferrin/lactoferrin receptor protein
MSCRRRGAAARPLEVSAIALMAAFAASSQASAQSVVNLDPVTVAATKTEEKVSEALAGVSVVRQDQIDQLMPKRTSDIFFGMPGVTFSERGDDPGTAINIRGLQDFGRVAVVIDGARQNFQTTGHNANGVFYLDPELIAGADVVRGPVANIYGSGAIGGVASFRTKDAEDVLRAGDRWGILANGMLGTNIGRGVGSVFGAARAGENVDIFVGGVNRYQNNYLDGDRDVVPNTGYRDNAGTAKVTVRPADGHEVKFTGITQDYRYSTGQQLATGGSLTSAESVFDTRLRNDITSGRWRYSRPDDRIFDFEGNVYWTRTNEQQTKIANGTTTSSGNAITGFVGDNRSFNIETKGFDVHNTSRFDTGPFRHALTYGADGFRDAAQSVDVTGTGDLFTPSGQRKVYGGFGQWKMNYSSWLEIIGAARYDAYKLEGGSVPNDGSRVSPKITVGVTPINWITVYGIYAEGYRAPAITETLVAGSHPPFATFPGAPAGFIFVPNPSLKPEVGKNKEIGVNIHQDDLFVKGDKIRIKANVFRNDLDDYINPVFFGPISIWGIPTFYQYQNIPNARIDGIEFESNYDAGRWFAGLSGTHLRGSNLTQNLPLATIPPDQISGTLGLRFFDGKVTFAARGTAVAAKNASDIPDTDRDGTPDFKPSKAYGLLNLYLGYQPNEDLLASLGIDNVFNAQYVRYLDYQASPGVTFKASLKIRFGDQFFRGG